MQRINTFKSWDEITKEMLADPAFKAAYDELEHEYQIAHALIGARLNRHWTQSELAEKAGVKQAYIARLESGDANPTVSSLNRVAKELGLQLKLA